MLDIVGFMFWDYSGMAILDQRSFLTGRIGSKLFGENVTIYDNVAHPLQSGSPFDGEGMRRQGVPLVENGVVKRVVYARATAERMKHSEHNDKVGPIEATGHGFALPNEMGEMPVNIVFAAPENPKLSLQMVASTERGVLMTRLWYIREVDPYEKIVTGMTRDGTFLLENGRVRQGRAQFSFQPKPDPDAFERRCHEHASAGLRGGIIRYGRARHEGPRFQLHGSDQVLTPVSILV